VALNEAQYISNLIATQGDISKDDGETEAAFDNLKKAMTKLGKEGWLLYTDSSAN
jgi:hypothetical protein